MVRDPITSFFTTTQLNEIESNLHFFYILLLRSTSDEMFFLISFRLPQPPTLDINICQHWEDWFCKYVTKIFFIYSSTAGKSTKLRERESILSQWSNVQVITQIYIYIIYYECINSDYVLFWSRKSSVNNAYSVNRF